MLRTPLLLFSFAAASAFAQGSPSAPPTAQEIIARIQKEVAIPWRAATVDTFKAGDPNTPVTGIAVTMMATFDVITKAAAEGKNLVITHEPTFYNHQDQTAALKQLNDPVLAEKEQFIRDHHMVVWRFHDHWHAMKPDGILLGVTKAIGWEAYQDASQPHLFELPATTLGALASELKRKLNINVVRVVGNPEMSVTHVALMPGAADSMSQMKMLENKNVQVLVIGETREWETVEYTADAGTEHRDKALIILGHIPSEQPGMEECTRWLKTFIHDVPITFIPAAEPFWPPPNGPRIVPVSK